MLILVPSRLALMFARPMMVGPRKSWLSILLLLVLAVPLPSPGVSAQTENQDVTIEAFQVPDPLVGGRDNVLEVVVRNDGVTPTSVRVFMAYEHAGVSQNFHESPDQVVPADSTTTVSVTWDALRECDSAPCDYAGLWINDGGSSTTLTARVQPSGGAQSEDASSVQRFIHYHDLRLDLQHRDQQTMAPGGQWSTTVYVDNVGNAWDTAELRLQSPTDGWTFRLERETTAVAPQGSAAVVLRAQAPTDAERGDGGKVYVLVESASVDLPADPQDRNLTVQAPYVELQGAVSADLSLRDPAVLPGQTARLWINATNGYNEDIRVTPDLELTSSPPGWSCENAQPCPTPMLDEEDDMVGPYNSTSFSVDLVVPEDPRNEAPDMARAGVYTWAVTLDLEDPQGNVVGMEELGPLSLEVLPARRLALENVSDVSDVSLVPGPDVPAGENLVQVRVTNLGNVLETLDIDTEGSPDGWTVSQDWAGRTADMEDLVLEPGASEYVNWTVETPPDHEPGDYDVSIRVQSRADPTVQSDDPVAFTATLQGLPRISLSGGTEIGIVAGGTVGWPVAVRNIGNEPAAVSVNHAIIEAVPSAGWSLNTGGPSFTLQPGASRSMTLEVEAPAMLSVQDGLTFDLSLDVADHSGQSVLQRFEAFLPSPDLHVQASAIGDPDPPFHGAQSNVPVTVTNTGTASLEESVQVIVTVSNETDAALSSKAFTLSSLGHTDGSDAVVLQVPLPDAAGVFVVSVVVDPQDRIDEHDEDDNEAAREVELRGFTLAVRMPLNRTAVPGQILSFEGARGFLLTNTGDAPLELGYRLSDLQGWMEPADEGSVTLEAGKSTSLEATLAVPANLDAQDGGLRLEVGPAGVPGATLEHVVAVHVVDETPPRITSVTATPNVIRAGQTVRFEATATDALGVAFVTGFLQPPDLEPSGLELTWDPIRQVWFREVRMAAVGDHSWYIWAKDNSTAGNEAFTSEDPVFVRVLPAQTEGLEALGSDSVRPGVPFEVVLFATTPIEDLTYQVDGGGVLALALTNPLQVPTAGLEEGAHEVRIRVNDTYGNRLDEVFSFEVDGTPPVIAHVSLQPNRTSSGATDVHIRFEDPGAIVSAKLRPLDGSQAGSSDIPMAIRDGVHSATLTQGAVERLVILAEDAAGNRLYHSMGPEEVEASTVHSGDANTTPTLGAVPILVALFFASCLVTWNRRAGRL